MNYLAHAYLSFEDPEVTTGNLISDFVKGKKKYDYPSRILGGIDLHRAIDAFTDSHPVTKEASLVFKADYGLYAGAFMDVVYDHFLAREISEKDEKAFLAYTMQVYDQIEQFSEMLPEYFNNIFPYMKQHNWLFNYQHKSGIERSMAGLVHRAKYLSDSSMAFRIFTENYERLQKAYQQFMPAVKDFSLEKFSDIH